MSVRQAIQEVGRDPSALNVGPQSLAICLRDQGL